MLYNYFKLAFRNFSRDRVHVAINVIGLGMGIALLVWGIQTYRFSMGWDTAQPDREHVFRAVILREGSEDLKGICPTPLAEAAKADFSSISQSVRWDSRGCDIKSDFAEPFSEQVHFTDPSFFELFRFPLLMGNYDLSDPQAVLLTEKMAIKYFGKTDPIGKPLLLYAGEKLTKPLTVKGVLQNVPLQSSFRFDFLTNIKNLKTSDTTFFKGDGWDWFLDAVFFKIPNPADVANLEKAFDRYIPMQNAARQDWKMTGVRLMSFKTMPDQTTQMAANGLINRPDDSAAYGPLITALLIFFSACLNFANTTVARSSRRLREMGVRKTMGGTRAQLVRQLLMECGAVVLLAVFCAVLINKWWLPVFNSMFTGILVDANLFSDAGLRWILIGILAFTTFLAGAYPAFYISSFNASAILKGGTKLGGTNLFSRFLLGLQVTISMITVIAGIGFARNSSFQRDYDYGYDRAGLMGLRLGQASDCEAMKNELRQLPTVEKIAATRHHIGFGGRTGTAEAEGQKHEVGFMEIGEGYLDLMGLRTVTGRAFEANRAADYASGLLITQKMATAFGWTAEQAIGKTIKMDTATLTVVGTLRDFHQRSLFNPIQPMAMRFVRPDRCATLVVRAKTAEVSSVFEASRQKWAGLFPLRPFNGFYQEESSAESQKVSNSLATIFSAFAVVAVLLTATGLFALVSLTVLKRKKEIALRKVVGATTNQIWLLVNHGYVWIFFLASIIGCLGGWFLTKLLMDAIFKINIGVEVLTFIAGVIALFGIAAATVGFLVQRAVRTNPAEVLRSE